MSADSNNSGLQNPGLAQTGNSQVRTNQVGANTNNKTGDTSGNVSSPNEIKGGVDTDKNSTGKPHADTAENENTTEADLVLNEDLNSTNDI